MYDEFHRKLSVLNMASLRIQNLCLWSSW